MLTCDAYVPAIKYIIFMPHWKDGLIKTNQTGNINLIPFYKGIFGFTHVRLLQSEKGLFFGITEYN